MICRYKGGDPGKMNREYITSLEAARRFGLDRYYVTRLARESRKAGNSYPVKRGRSWEATEEEWAKILNPRDKKVRKTRKRQIGLTDKNFAGDPGVSCTRAAEKLGVSSSWARKLAQRAKKKGFQWPEKQNSQWIAPLDEWRRIFEDPSLRQWRRKK